MKVAVVMGSSSDLPTLEPALETLRSFGIDFEARVVSAHRTPEHMIEFGKTAADRGFGVIIAVPSVAGFLMMTVDAPPPYTLGAVNLPAFALVIAMTMITTPTRGNMRCMS